MRTYKELTRDEVATLLTYEPETGKFAWCQREHHLFPTVGACKAWNTRYSGTEALTAYNSHGYHIGCIFDMAVVAHHVAWLLTHGEWPEFEIDHINGVRDDNRMENLRSVSHQDNMRNRKLQKNNTSGVQGVIWDTGSDKWEARIHVSGRKIILGRFHEFDAAVAARKKGEIDYGFHEHHGRVEASIPTLRRKTEEPRP